MRLDKKRNNKTLFVIILSLLMLGIIGDLGGNLVNGAITPSLYVSPTSYSASSLGETVPIQVVAYMVFNLTGFQFQLRFNTTLLRCLNASLGSFFPQPPNSTSTVTVDNVHGNVSIQAHIQGSGAPVNGWGTVLSVNFNATYATTYPLPNDKCNLTITNDTLYGIGDQPITHVVQNGVYKAPYVPPQLSITLNTAKNNYHYEDRINVNGTLTGNGYPIPDALVALEVQGPNHVLMVARTFQTSSIPVSCPLQITGVTPCQQDGTPQDSFSVGSTAYFSVAVKNPGSNNVNGLISVNPYDSSNTTLGVNSLPITIPAAGNTTVILSLPLQYDSRFVLTPATSGNATVYANVWTDFIGNGGTVLALEKAATFTITGTPQGNPIYTSPQPQGTYQANFAIHFNKGLYGLTLLPNYTINVEAKYMGNRVAQTKQIQVILAGDVNVDGKVNLNDLVLLALAYGSSSGNPKWNPNADVNGDGTVSLSDLVMLALNYSKGTV